MENNKAKTIGAKLAEARVKEEKKANESLFFKIEDEEFKSSESEYFKRGL